MAYTPPSGSAADFGWLPLPYTPPSDTAVDFSWVPDAFPIAGDVVYTPVVAGTMPFVVWNSPTTQLLYTPAVSGSGQYSPFAAANIVIRPVLFALGDAHPTGFGALSYTPTANGVLTGHPLISGALAYTPTSSSTAYRGVAGNASAVYNPSVVGVFGFEYFGLGSFSYNPAVSGAGLFFPTHNVDGGLLAQPSANGIGSHGVSVQGAFVLEPSVSGAGGIPAHSALGEIKYSPTFSSDGRVGVSGFGTIIYNVSNTSMFVMGRTGGFVQIQVICTGFGEGSPVPPEARAGGRVKIPVIVSGIGVA